MQRRAFLAGLAACAAAPAWTASGVTHLAAARDPSGAFALYGIGADAALLFRIPLPARGHAAAAHPQRAEAVAFARRPGTFGIVIDCATGAVTARLNPPTGRHFYGHGAYTADGAYLLTTENAYATGEGRIGIWDTRDWRRVEEISSGGIGPHEIIRLSSGGFAVANGGIRTHPDRGRDKLNLDTMAPNLGYLDAGRVVDTVTLRGLQQASIRHLAAHGETVAVALQWEGPEDRTVPLLALHRRGAAPRLLEAGSAQAGFQGYAGSVAISGDGARVAITGPRGGVAHTYRIADGVHVETTRRTEICGTAPAGQDLAFTDGLGGILHPQGARRHPVAWDNHLVAV